MNYVGTSKLAKQHGKSVSFMNIVLCRGEFGQYRKNEDDGYFKFRDDVNLHKQIAFIIKQKADMQGKTCRFAC